MTASGESISFNVGSDPERWQKWLANGQPFRVEGMIPGAGYKGNLLTARSRRSQRGQEPYWFAYKRVGGKLYTAYLGKAESVTLATLDQAARKIQDKVHEDAQHSGDPGYRD